MSSSSPITLPLRIYVTHATRNRGSYAAVWDANEAMYIRSELRILGDFCGTLPKHIAQNQYLSVPLILSYEETLFGVARGFFTLIRDDVSDYMPNEYAGKQFWEDRQKGTEEQIEQSFVQQMEERARRAPKRNDNNKVGEKRKHVDIEFEGPVRKAARTVFQWVGVRWRWLTAPLFGEHDATDEAELLGNDNSGKKVEEPKVANEDKELETRLRHQAHAAALVVTSTAARPDEGAKRVRTSMERPRGVPEKRLRDRLRVFEDMHDRGYLLSCGAKFGADFLAYAGSPQLFHAALAIVVVEKDQKMSARSIVAIGRLGDATKKRTVLAFVDGVVQYVGVQWEETLP